MVRLNEWKICWIVQEKLRGRGTSKIATIQRVSHRQVEQIWQVCEKTGRPGKRSIELHEATLILKTCDLLKVNALTLERILMDIYEIKSTREGFVTILVIRAEVLSIFHAMT